MILVAMDNLINDTPVGSLTEGMWITEGKLVIYKDNAISYKLTNNPNPHNLRLSEEEYDQLTEMYFEYNPPVDPRQPLPIAKHLAGKHDQATHGRKGSTSYDTSEYDRLNTADNQEFFEAMEKLTRPDGTKIDSGVIGSAKARYGFRSIPAPEGFENNFEVLDEEFRAFVKDNPVSIMMPEEAIELMLDDGRVKTIFDMPEAKGEEYLDHRLAYERTAFGYEGTFPNESRPVSGTVLPTAQNQEAFYAFGDHYGSAQVVLKDEVKSRTTYTLGDSLDTFQKPTSGTGKVPRTMDLITSAQRAAYSRKNDNKTVFETLRFWNDDYLEAQVHGGVKLSDIAKIIFHSPIIALPTFALDELGIDYEVTER